MSSFPSVQINTDVLGHPLSLCVGSVLVSSGVVAAGLPPAVPANPSTAAITSTSVVWSWQDMSSNERAFTVWTGPGAVYEEYSDTVPADLVVGTSPRAIVLVQPASRVEARDKGLNEGRLVTRNDRPAVRCFCWKDDGG